MMANQHQRGFTLLETMIAVAVLMVILLPLTGLFLQSSQQITASRHSTTALYTAQDILEQIKSNENTPINSTDWTGLPTSQWFYRIQVKETDHHLQEVTVTIRYPVAGQQQLLSLTMLQPLGVAK